MVQKGNILIPKGQKERKSVTFAIRLRTIWYDREGVKFRDSGSEIERNIAKRQICHTLLERSIGASSGAQRHKAPKDFRSKYDSSYATFTPTLAYLWYLLVTSWDLSCFLSPSLYGSHAPKYKYQSTQYVTACSFIPTCASCEASTR